MFFSCHIYNNLNLILLTLKRCVGWYLPLTHKQTNIFLHYKLVVFIQILPFILVQIYMFKIIIIIIIIILASIMSIIFFL
jgi:hypothetical protein